MRKVFRFMARHPLRSVVLFACLVQIAFVLESHRNPAFRYPLVDAATYHKQAVALAEGGQAPVRAFWQPPLYPYLLAALYRLLPPHMLPVRLLHGLLLGAAAAALLYLCARRLAGERAARWTALAFCLYGPWVFYASQLLPAGLATVLGLGLLLASLRFIEAPSIPRALLCGVLLGLQALTVPNILLALPLVLALIGGRMRPDRRRALLAAGAILAGVLACLLPVTIRNRVVSGEWTVLSTNAGINWFIGNNPMRDETLAIRPGIDWDRLTARPYREGGADSPAQANAWFMKQTAAYALRHPVAFTGGLIRKARRLLSSVEIPRNIDLYAFARRSLVLRPLAWKLGSFGFPLGILWPLALTGFACGPHRQAAFRWLLALTGIYAASLVLFFPSSRYLIPMVPWLILGASAGVRSLAQRPAAEKAGLRVPAAVCLATAVLVNLPVALPTDAVAFDAELETQIGVARQVRGEPRAALEHYLQALEYDNDNADTWFYQGTAWRELGALDRAVEAQGQALLHRPDHYRAMNELAVLLYRREQPAEAEALLREAIKLNPGDPTLMKNLAIALIAQGRTEEASAWLQRAAGRPQNR